MKHILIIFALVAFTGCSKLDLVPISERSVEGFYKTPAQINQALMGCYNGLRDVLVRQQYSYMLTESRSDNTFQSLDYNDGNTSRFTETSLLPVLYTGWSNSYNKIQQCNKVLEELVKIEIPEALARQYEGEAKFIRALVYFNLVRLWGPVPLVTSSISIQDGYKVVRNSEEEIYKQIDQDLTDAAAVLPDVYDNSNKGRATKWAAKGFLGKSLVFQSGYPLKKNKWAAAAAILKEVMDSGRFEFFARYDDVFKYENEAGKQSVFSITFKAGVQGEGNPFPTRNAPNFVSKTLVPFGGGPNMLFVSAELVNSFEAGDLRRDAAIWREWLNNAGENVASMPFSKKYLNGAVVAANDWDIDWIALRYDDILMLYAESLNEVGYNPSGEAFTIMNKIRVRAGLKAKIGAEVPSQAQFRLWVENERRWEFCFENQRWFDLVRTDRALDVMKEFLGKYGLAANMQSRDRYFYPVPQQVIDVNSNITQNKGYN
jgi:starch-binding outer membrane protein, SusD/RagB family